MPYKCYKNIQENEKHILQLNFFVLFFPVFSSYHLTLSLFREKKHHMLAAWAQKKAISLNSQNFLV